MISSEHWVGRGMGTCVNCWSCFILRLYDIQSGQLLLYIQKQYISLLQEDSEAHLEWHG